VGQSLFKSPEAAFDVGRRDEQVGVRVKTSGPVCCAVSSATWSRASERDG
jgi:hypothetical protein